MSQLKVDEILDASGGSNAVLYGPASPAGSMGFRNRIINGDMRIDQRNAGASVTPATFAYPVDRWRAEEDTDGAYTIEQVEDAPAGFVQSLKVTVTTADASIGATQTATVQQRIEGNNVADFNLGTANAKTFTLSFWVKSSLTGTFGGGFSNAAENRSYAFTYTISAADTWEYKTVTVAGDTTGTWQTGTSTGLRVNFGLAAGSTYAQAPGSWSADAKYFSATGAVNVLGTLNATWYITGVQLEVGSVATEFERRPYGTELALCQRYYLLYASGIDVSICTGAMYSSSLVFGGVSFPVSMRTAPTLSQTTGTNYYAFERNSDQDFFDSFLLARAGPLTAQLYQNSGVSGTVGHGGLLETNTSSARLAFSAEL